MSEATTLPTEPQPLPIFATSCRPQHFHLHDRNVLFVGVVSPRQLLKHLAVFESLAHGTDARVGVVLDEGRQRRLPGQVLFENLQIKLTIQVIS